MSKKTEEQGKVLLAQNPHAVREPRENNLELAIGHEVRKLRKKLGLTVTDLSNATGISSGMLSKIENGNISPSLASLQALSRALGIPLTTLFRGFEERRSASLVKSGEGLNIERRGTRAGHQYSLLGHIDDNSSGVMVEPYLITLEFLYMISGEVVYRHANLLYRMRAGDSLLFDADAPHGPEQLVRLPARYLSIICYRPNQIG